MEENEQYKQRAEEIESSDKEVALEGAGQGNCLQLCYGINPVNVYVGTTQTLTLSISNPSSGTDLSINASTDEIDVFIPVPSGSPGGAQAVQAAAAAAAPVGEAGALTDDLANITYSSLTQGWSCTLVSDPIMGSYFKVFPLADTTVHAGDTVQIRFDVPVNSVLGMPVIGITESIGGNSQALNLSVTKTDHVLSITAWADPPNVGQDMPSNLNWNGWGGAHIVINPGNLKVPCSGPGPYTGNVPVIAGPPNTPYTVTIWTQDQQWSKDIAIVYLNQPVVRFSSDAAGPINVADDVTLSWNVIFSPSVALTTNRKIQVHPKDTLTFKPGGLLVGNQGSVDLYLTAQGYQGPVKKKLTLKFKPVRIVYFRFKDPQLTQVDWQVENGTAEVSGPDGNGLYTLVATGPGGPLTQYLGPGPYLEIQYFGASPEAVAPGGKSTLSYVALNADSLRLDSSDGKSVTPPLGPDGKGSYDVTPAATTTYTLTAIKGGNKVTSPLTVTVNK